MLAIFLTADNFLVSAIGIELFYFFGLFSF